MKTVVITGASRGIGKALAERFLHEGYRVIGTSRSGIANIQHANLTMIPLELTDSNSRERCIQTFTHLHAPIDILINNAGIWHPKDDQDAFDLDVLRETLEVNLLGPIDLVQRLIPFVHQDGHILHLTSRRGSMDYTTESMYPAYSLSKAALNMFGRKLAARLKGHITISLVHPGKVQTDMNDGEGDFTPDEAASHIFTLATNPTIETGRFWFQGERFPW